MHGAITGMASWSKMTEEEDGRQLRTYSRRLKISITPIYQAQYRKLCCTEELNTTGLP